MRIAVVADHGGFSYKDEIVKLIDKLGHTAIDLGCGCGEPVDYPDYAFPVCEALARGEYDRAVLICGTGIGMSICANKVKGVRCALCSDAVSARLTREHNNANALAMGARIIGIETAKAITEAWLATEYSNAARHTVRIDKITGYEMRADSQPFKLGL